MKIFLRGKMYDSSKEPIGVRFSEDDLENVKTMSKHFDTYVAGPKDHRTEMVEIINKLKPDVSKSSHG